MVFSVCNFAREFLLMGEIHKMHPDPQWPAGTTLSVVLNTLKGSLQELLDKYTNTGWQVVKPPVLYGFARPGQAEQFHAVLHKAS